MAVLTKITTRTLADNAVTSAKIADGAIAVADVGDGSISTAKLADDAVTGAKLENNPTVAGNLTVSGTTTLTGTAVIDGIAATNATTVAGTYSSQQERVHGSTFTTTGTTVTGDVVFESLTDETVTLSGTGTITGSGGRIMMKGLDNSQVVTKSEFQDALANINTGKNTQADFTVKGTLGNDVKFPSGMVLQTKHAVDANSSRTTTHTQFVEVPGLTVNLTTKVENSKILVMVYSGYSGLGQELVVDLKRQVGTGATAQFWDGIVEEDFDASGDLSGAHAYGWGTISHASDASHNTWATFNAMYMDQPRVPAGTFLAYSPMMANQNNSTAVYWSHSGSHSCILIQEKAP